MFTAYRACKNAAGTSYTYPSKRSVGGSGSSSPQDTTPTSVEDPAGQPNPCRQLTAITAQSYGSVDSYLHSTLFWGVT